MKPLLFLALFCFSCSHSVYYVVNEKNFAHEIQKQDERKLILIREQLIPNNDNLVRSVNKQHWPEFEQAQYALADKQAVKFLHAIRLLVESQYALSYKQLSQLPDTDFDCQVLLLKMDCLHSLHADTVNYQKQYQRAMDCTSNENVKTIINKRYRLFKYGY